MLSTHTVKENNTALRQVLSEHGQLPLASTVHRDVKPRLEYGLWGATLLVNIAEGSTEHTRAASRARPAFPTGALCPSVSKHTMPLFYSWEQANPWCPRLPAPCAGSKLGVSLLLVLSQRPPKAWGQAWERGHCLSLGASQAVLTGTDWVSPWESKRQGNSCQTCSPENFPEINGNLAAGYVQGSSRTVPWPRLTFE